ncbi:replication-relaxation family protein [Pseudonocardia nematodicida]|uniref:Replication-relaxation family protein n=1 Tax=Pseudonocardia nematodicida TaxID=1206997 RepID=A0ABV1KBC4_9PSEU
MTNIYPFPHSADRPSDRNDAGSAPTSGHVRDPAATVPLRRSGNPRPARARTLARHLTDRDRQILRSLADFRLMTGQQLGQLHVDGQTPATAARRRRSVLQRLADCGAIQRLERRIGGIRAGSDGQLFALTPLGLTALRLHDPEVPNHRVRLIGDTAPGFQDHLLAITELYVQLREADDGHHIELLDFQTEPAAWRRFTGPAGETIPLKPDAYLSLGLGELEQRSFVEVDLATESLNVVARKCRRYLEYWQTGTEQAAHGVFPRVWWLVPHTRRELRLRELVAGFAPIEQALFAVGQLDDAAALLTTPVTSFSTEEPS